MPRELTEEERTFLCKAYEQARNHPQNQAINEAVTGTFSTEDFVRIRAAMEDEGYVDRGGAGMGESGGFWITQAGMKTAEEICD